MSSREISRKSEHEKPDSYIASANNMTNRPLKFMQVNEYDLTVFK